MTPQRWQQIKELFHAALDVPVPQRAAFLAQACATDEALREEVESLLTADEKPGPFLAQSPVGIATNPMASAASENISGQRLGTYEVVEQIGQGGMGVVYRANDVRFDRPLALKVLHTQFTQNQDRVRRFQQEARAALALNHPNILTIYEVGQIDKTLFIAAELIVGQTLRERMAAEDLPLHTVLDIVLQVAGALQAAHEAGIVHRDIKPENIMVRPDGYVKVLDFGLAKLLRDDGGRMRDESEKDDPLHPSSLIHHPSTMPGIVMGTPRYMSPEQARGYEVDARTDIFSLGVVLYELIAKREPFGGPTSHDVLASLLQAEPLPLTRFVPQLPAELQRIVSRALKKDRAERYPSMAAFRHDLQALKQQMERETQLFSPAAMVAHEAMVGQTRSAPRSWRPVWWVATAILLLMSLAYLGWLWKAKSGASSQTAMPIQSVAVLPFKPLVVGQRDEVLEMGIADTLITRLSSLQKISIRPINSVRRYTALDVDPVAVGRELQVQAVLEGSILKADNKIRITARLLNVADGKPLWTRQFDERWTNIFAVQDSIAQQFANDLAITLTGPERNEMARNYTSNPEAYELFMTGRYHWNKRSGAGITKAIAAFQQAIEKDPNYALAYIGLADAYATLGSYHLAAPKQVLPLAREAAEKALHIDPNMAEAHATLGKLSTDYFWDWARADQEFKRAIALKPNYANAHHWYSTLLAHQGHFDEAVRAATTALELDPQSLVVGTQLGAVLYRARRYDQSITALQKIVALEPNYVTAHMYLGFCYTMQARYSEALAEFQKCHTIVPDLPDAVAMVGATHALAGKRAEALQAQRELNEMVKRTYVSPFCQAAIPSALGNMDETFHWLEKCLEERDPSIRGLRIDPLFDRVRSDPRYLKLLQRVETLPTS